MTMTLKGKVALVTGAGRGIGRAIALRLARDGADIGLVDIHVDDMQQVAAEIAALGRSCACITTDVRQREAVFAAVAQAQQQLGGLDVMVNNAGISLTQSLLKVRPADIEKVFSINVLGVLWGIQAAAESFQARGRPGNIINAASVAGLQGTPFLGTYCASKFGVRSLTQTAARELAADGIRVNCYCPGVIDTLMWQEIDGSITAETGTAPGSRYQQGVAGIPLGRAGTPQDVAALVSFLAGPDADYITGQSLTVDGGMMMH